MNIDGPNFNFRRTSKRLNTRKPKILLIYIQPPRCDLRGGAGVREERGEGGGQVIGIFFIQTRLYVDTSTGHNIAASSAGLHASRSKIRKI